MPVSALLDSGSKINAIYLTFAREQELPIMTVDVKAQKIDNIMLDSFGIVVAAFSVTDKANQVKFIEKTFLVTNVILEVVFRMPFLTLSSVNVDFLRRELRWRTNTTKKALPTTRRVELVGKKKFAAATLDLESEIFVVHIVSPGSDRLPSSSPLGVHPSVKERPRGKSVDHQSLLPRAQGMLSVNG